jgi:chemotaxis protein MotA
MDRLTLFGLLVAFTGIVGGQLLEGGSVSTLVQGASFLIVVGGTAGAVMVQSPLNIFISGLKMARQAFVTPDIAPQRLLYQLGSWCSVARRDGYLKLESQLVGIKDPFLYKGMQLLVDGNSASRIRDVMEVELRTFEQLQYQSARVWESAAGYSPTIGIMGAVLGLGHVMQSLGEPSHLGPGIAVAFVSTIYGVGLANLVFLPIANKLKLLISRQVAMREMFIDGLEMIANGENTRYMGSKLQGYLI